MHLVASVFFVWLFALSNTMDAIVQLYNQGVYTDNSTYAVDQLLIWKWIDRVVLLSATDI